MYRLGSAGESYEAQEREKFISSAQCVREMPYEMGSESQIGQKVTEETTAACVKSDLHLVIKSESNSFKMAISKLHNFYFIILYCSVCKKQQKVTQ